MRFVQNVQFHKVDLSLLCRYLVRFVIISTCTWRTFVVGFAWQYQSHKVNSSLLSRRPGTSWVSCSSYSPPPPPSPTDTHTPRLSLELLIAVLVPQRGSGVIQCGWRDDKIQKLSILSYPQGQVIIMISTFRYSVIIWLQFQFHNDVLVLWNVVDGTLKPKN